MFRICPIHRVPPTCRKDGRRKPATQDYHGRGTAHSRSLDFLENMGSIKLEQEMAATVPTDADKFLKGLVMMAMVFDDGVDGVDGVDSVCELVSIGVPN